MNHAIAGTTSGGGGYGGPDRNGSGSPNARTVVGGVTRFEGEVLGRGYPWLGGEPYGPLPRVNAFAPDAASFAYVSIGTNDAFAMPVWQTLDNIEWMVRTWIGAGQAADHIVLTTLAPGNHYDRELVPAVNAGIRALAARTGAGLIDLAAFTSPDDGRTWRHAGLHVGDELHYSEAVRDWLAAEMVAHMQPRVR